MLLIGISWYVNPLIVAVLPVVIAIVLIWVKSPFSLLMLFIIFVTARLAELVPLLGTIHGGQILSLGALTIFVISKIQNRDAKIYTVPIMKWFAIFSLWVTVSTIFSTNSGDSFDNLIDGYLKTVILFLLMTQIVISRRQVIIIQITLSIISSFIGGFAYFSYLSGQNLLGGSLVEGTRAGYIGALYDPNDTAWVILMTIPFLVTAIIEIKDKKKYLFFVLLFFSVAGLLATQSRGGLLGLTASVGVVMNRYIKNKVVLISIALCVLVVSATFANISGRESGGAKEEGIDESAQGRLDAWEAGIWMLIKNPITGVGFGQSKEKYLEYVINPVIYRPLPTHNSYIQIASELGIPGIVAFGMILWICIKNSLVISRQVPKGRISRIEDIVKISLFPCLIAVLVPAFFLTQGYYVLIYIIFALNGAASRIYNGEIGSCK